MKMPEKYTGRVEEFAILVLEKILKSTGFVNTNPRIIKTIACNCDFTNIASKIEKYAELRHSGNYGPLEAHLQRKLNLLLLAFDLTGKDRKEQRKLVKAIIIRDSKYKQDQEQQAMELESIKKLMKEMKAVDQNLKNFFAKIDTLYVLRKNALRRLITDEELYNTHLLQLDNIFEKHLNKIRVFTREDKALG